KINDSGAYPSDIVTTIEPFENYSEAEEYHQNYYSNNGSQGYCTYVIQPKVEKFRKAFAEKLK
ncbi:MAG TPA: peptide-methionine (S)-S-oxide reductase, partial [Flavobacteriales bacterium]|nr:peptide-methionine (S)-S-oxide reductase [Flavobacteriales bacterium]